MRSRHPLLLAASLVTGLLLGAAPAGPAAGAPVAMRSPAWSWPVAPPHIVARPYLAPPGPYGAGHRGIDIRAPAGAPVHAPADGVVHFAGVVVDRPVLSIDHGGGVLSSFEPVESTLRAGDVVHRGDVVGVLLAGHCVAPCLHLGERLDGAYVNPLLALGGLEHSVLYPARSG
jgi:murein DD-endopeptidase MepM/ murein hydrolase activator NlpD